MELPTLFLRDVLQSVLEDIGLDPNSKYECHQIAAHLLLSSLYRVTVHHSGTASKNFIMKSLRLDPTLIETFDTPAFFRNESMFYKRIVTAFEEFQKQWLGKDSVPINSMPKCYKTVCSDKDNVIVLEDLNESGYCTVARSKILEVPELFLLVKELGRFHALSIALKDKNPEVFGDLKKNSVKESVLNEKHLDKVYRVGFGFAAIEIVKRVKKLQPLETRYVEKLEIFSTDKIADKLQTIICPKEEDELYNVFTHGDIWINNLLFHYEAAENDGRKNPDRICFVDFQMCRYGSIALDISAVLFLLMDQKMRDNYRGEVLQIYHRSVSEFLGQLGCDPEKLFPFSAIEVQLSKYSLFNLGMSFLMPFWLDNDDGSEVDVSVENSDSSAGASVMEGPYRRISDECFQRIVDVIRESVDRGYL